MQKREGRHTRWVSWQDLKGVYRHATSVTRCGICKVNGGYMLTYDRPRSSNEVEKSIIARGQLWCQDLSGNTHQAHQVKRELNNQLIFGQRSISLKKRSASMEELKSQSQEMALPLYKRITTFREASSKGLVVGGQLIEFYDAEVQCYISGT